MAQEGVRYIQNGPKCIYVLEVGPYVIFPNYNFGEFPQPVTLLFFWQNSRGYSPTTLRFTGYTDLQLEIFKIGAYPRETPVFW